MSEAVLFVVQVSDTLEPKLAGHTGRRYHSPPQTERHARELIALMLDVPEPPTGRGPWQSPRAGGRRWISLRAVPDA